jgi:cell division protein FtsW (lipid II flippase)
MEGELMDRELKLTFTALIVLTIVDGVQTIFLLSDHGVHAEANPLMKSLIQNFGFIGMWGIKVATLIVVGLVMKSFSRPVMPLLVGLMALVVTNNFYYLNVNTSQSWVEASVNSRKLYFDDQLIVIENDVQNLNQ